MSREIRAFCREHNLKPKNIEIVSGGAKGADSLGEYFAKFYNIKLKVFNPNWEMYGKMAGFIRNEDMAIYAKSNNGGCIVFWNGVSSGSKQMIKMAMNYKLNCKVVKYESN